MAVLKAGMDVDVPTLLVMIGVVAVWAFILPINVRDADRRRRVARLGALAPFALGRRNLGDTWPNPAVGAVVLQQLTNPLGFAAAIAAREVPIWVGGLVAKRGRTARARNAAARTAYEQELAEHRATIGGTTAV